LFIQGTEPDAAGDPAAWLMAAGHVLARGRDPYFPPWPDVVQLNAFSPALRAATASVLADIASQCDGIRCDMAMLMINRVFSGTWGHRAGAEPEREFWPDVIGALRAEHASTVLIAEAYWDMESELQNQGFDFCYDKRLYDRIVAQDIRGVREHLRADLGYQSKLLRFLENHDEPRAASFFPPEVHRAAAVITFLVPGYRLLHEGQCNGRRIRVPVQLRRRPEEPPDDEIGEFYKRSLSCLRRVEVREGAWWLIDCRAAWEGNPTADRFIAFLWSASNSKLLVTAVNYGSTQAQCYLPVPAEQLRGKQVLLRDLLSTASCSCEGTVLVDEGLFLDLPAWGYHVFEVITGAV
jgi:hypothetical protein